MRGRYRTPYPVPRYLSFGSCLPIQGKGFGNQGAGDHGSHAKYTHHDEDLSRAMENPPEVKEKRFPYWKKEGKLVFTGGCNMRFLKKLAVNLLITQVPALFLLIAYPHASLTAIILLSAGTLILAVYILRYIIKCIRVGHVLNPSSDNRVLGVADSTRSRRDEEPSLFWLSIMVWGAFPATLVWFYIVNIDISFNRDTPMHQAARWEKNIEYLKEYFASGGDVNLKDSSWFYPEYAGNTLLHDAVEGGNIEAVKLLIENEADLNRLNNAGRAPMDLAVKVDDNALADLLRKNGAKTAGELKAEGK